LLELLDGLKLSILVPVAMWMIFALMTNGEQFYRPLLVLLSAAKERVELCVLSTVIFGRGLTEPVVFCTDVLTGSGLETSHLRARNQIHFNRHVALRLCYL
jgi:hypothetical protein